MRCVTVVIPVHNGLEETLACLASCKRYIDQRHSILVIDDASREDVWMPVKAATERLPNARFVRNEKNLGFVKSCNRAVLEIDTTKNDILLLNADTVVTEGFLEEMLECLYLSERHAACSPRTDCGTLCTVPLRLRGRTDPARSFACWQRLKPLLPRFSVAPTAVGFCMLLKRDLIRRFGLFDTAYGKGYHEENDWCFRLNRLGYSSIVAHGAFVFHKGWHSFGADAYSALEQNNRHILLKRYPEFAPGAARYFDYASSAADHFGDILGGYSQRPQVLYDLSHLPAAHNGTSEYALRLLEQLIPMAHGAWDLTILASKRCDAFFRLSARFGHVVHLDRLPEKRFDLAFVPQQIFSIDHLGMLNRIAVRIVMNLHDIIALRTQKLRTNDSEWTIRLALLFADGIVSVSESSLRDAELYFGPEDVAGQRLRMKAIYHGIDAPMEHIPEAPFQEPFIFVVGNSFTHKAVDYVVPHLPADMPAVILGGTHHAGKQGNRVFLKSGALNSEEIEALYARCTAVVYPSQYEGFGLPLLHAARYRKQVIACDTEVNHELRGAFGMEKGLHLFRSFEDIPSLIARAVQEPPLAIQNMRTWTDAARETFAFLHETLEMPADVAKLERRFSRLQLLEDKHVRASLSGKGPLRRAHQTLASYAGRKLNRFPRAKKHLTRVASALHILP